MSTNHERHMPHEMRASATSPLPNPLGGERRIYVWRGHRVAYVVHGHGDPIVFIHSIHAAAWNAEWRRTVPALTEHTSYALDLLGFGASDRPPLRYTAQLYLQLIHDFLVDVVGEPALLVGSSLGATYAIAIAADHPQLVRGVVAIGPGGVSRLITQGGMPFGAIQGTFRTPVVGAALFKALVSHPSIRFFLKDIYAFGLDRETEQLYWLSANQPNARFAPAAFVGMQLNWDIRQRIAQVECPLLIAWGTRASQTPYAEAAQVMRRAPQAELVSFEAGDLPHEEVPHVFNAVLKDFAHRTVAAV
ncbi:alpha/beta fold hydrolase [Gemmatimonas sp.]|jgi:pimeloyl-ACP methyl ester carboxylesterase|uniref:alpha/beta fold hydrolase n=1 Tax=Gemmatimonas sp. TaxID=1962908 RepID=UPI0022C23A07|nr:alpha/beta fold hydrolase [Gemmatimonas sp.]MCA2983577.1 alpha/beta fold hydrolase [Gemmatimonas sp.]MCA2988712.1 alpha/beta fold hydrolase [Gemmatimonas sp.]MCA2989863.1 alpha/beta fold hydrolase [Gemmatimonas sp.]MCA2995492.1 alpha/beta fold hydrolase [Gemmatimonas sp.]MCE2955492.1 alpha/beta fold hydrolase [Gemmatimonas sp.]